MELGSRDLHATRDRTAQDAATAGWSEEKTVHKSPSAELKEVHTEKQTLASNVDIAKDEGLPEVVPASDNAKAHSNGAATNECTIESESKTVQNPEGDAYQTHKSPPLPDRNARSVPYDPDSVGPSRGPNTSSPIAAQPNNPPGYHHMTGMSPYAKTVTPLNLLADQADLIDCPFCQRRAETTVKTPASLYTHLTAVGLAFGTIVGVVLPYLCHWCEHIDHYCSNCNRRVTHKQFLSKEVEIYGTPVHLREVSRFPEAGQN